MPIRYWALIILLGAVWGCSFLFNAVLIREISPLWVSAGRVTIGATICWLVFLAVRKPLPDIAATQMHAQRHRRRPILDGTVVQIDVAVDQSLRIVTALGPILLGAAKPVHILTPSATVRRIVNMTALTVVDACEERQSNLI